MSTVVERRLCNVLKLKEGSRLATSKPQIEKKYHFKIVIKIWEKKLPFMDSSRCEAPASVKNGGSHKIMVTPYKPA